MASRSGLHRQTLPCELFGRILELFAAPDDSDEPVLPEAQWLVAVQRLQTIALVCKGWRAAVYGEPRLWRLFFLGADRVLADCPAAQQAAWLDSIHGLLRRGVGQHVAAFKALDGLGLSTIAGASCGWRMESFLALLQPSVLRSLHVTHSFEHATASLAFWEAVTRLSRLSELRLHAGVPGLPHCTPQLLRGLPQLCSLGLRSSWDVGLSGGVLDSVYQLRQLAELELHLPAEPSLAGLSALSLLRCLRLFGGFNAPAPSAFPHLESCFVSAFQVPDEVGSFFSLECQAGELRLLPNSRGFDMWPPTLSALLPPAGPPLHSLELLAQRLPILMPAMLDCPHLAGLTSLRLIDQHAPQHGHANEVVDFEWDSEEEAAYYEGIEEEPLAALLAQAPRLAELCLDDSLAGAFPSCLADRTGLTSLSLQGAQLEYLPAGRYLEGLLHLDLSENSFDQLPPTLAAATGLTHLALDSCRELTLLTANLQWLLACLPQLQELSLERVALTHAALEWLRESAPPGLAVTHTPAYEPPGDGDASSSGGSDWGSEEDD